VAVIEGVEQTLLGSNFILEVGCQSHLEFEISKIF
jgi:hypothetical protein